MRPFCHICAAALIAVALGETPNGVRHAQRFFAC